MIAYRMRAIVRNPRTNEINGYGQPILMNPEQALDHMRNDAMYWELVEKDVEVPDDDRGNPHQSAYAFKPASSIGDLSGPKGRRS